VRERERCNAFPTARLRVRLDGGFASPKLFAFFERQALEYVVAMASNPRLDKRARRLMGRARMLSKATGQTAHLYGETRYAAKSWERKRRVIIKAEVVRHPGRAPKNNLRFVVTNLPHQPETVYTIYCQRGDVENRLKELHHGLALDRTSCSRFWANQVRVLLTLAAYVLLQELRRRAAGTTCADAQVSTLRERLIKLAARVECSVRRIVLHLAAELPVAVDLAPSRAGDRCHSITGPVGPSRSRPEGEVFLASVPADPRYDAARCSGAPMATCGLGSECRQISNVPRCVSWAPRVPVACSLMNEAG